MIGARCADVNVSGMMLDGDGRRGPVCHDDVGLQADQLLRERSYPIIIIIAVPPKVHPQVGVNAE